MDIMNFDKALSILGLTRNYTEEDLKKAYRKLMIKYHPDKWSGKSESEKKIAEEKAKEINAAKDFLEKYKGKGTNTYRNSNNNNNSYYSHTAHNYVVFVQVKESFIRSLNNYDTELRELMYKTCPEDLQKTIKTLLGLNYLYRDIINRHVKNITDLNKKIIEYKAKVEKELEAFTTEYCRKYDINFNKSKLEKYSLKKLYEQLEKLRNEQNGITTKLNKKQEKYKLYVGYNIIKENIEIIKAGIIREYNEGLITEDKAIATFEKQILKEFKEYFRRLEVINRFKNLGYKDKEIRAVIALMEENITADKAIFKIYEQKVTNLIAEKETQRTSEVSIKPFNITENKTYNNNDVKIKKNHYIKTEEPEKPKYKIKKYR